MPDWWGSEARWFEDTERAFIDLMRRWGFIPVRLPLLEPSALFHNSLGEFSDAVSKETYTFEDRSGQSVTLRPEATASVVRFIIEERLAYGPLPLKLYYWGPMFRYERPQKGRFRQFHQLGVEVFGSQSEEAEAEVLFLAWRFLQVIGLSQDVTIHLNTLGDETSRVQYIQAFRDFLKPFYQQLSPDSQIRFERNPLRIWDSKEKQDREILQKAPSLWDFLPNFQKQKLQNLMDTLQECGLPVILDKTLVRGFDYYTHLVFEFRVSAQWGAQNTLLAGGRYDSLVERWGGPPTPALGWAAGLERLALYAQKVQDLNQS